MFGRRTAVGVGIAIAMAAVCAAQEPETSVNASLASLTQRASTIFAGEVVAICHTGGIVEVDFRVDQPLKSTATAYTLREWGGLWAAGQRRYWIGERAVFFLHASSTSGLATPVDGMDGVLPLVPPGDGSVALAVDVRRLRTRGQREVGQPMADAVDTLSLAAVSTVVAAQFPVPAKPVLPVRARPILQARPPIPEPELQMPEMVRRINASR